MEITEVRIKLMENPEDRLRGFCSITFDGSFVIRDLKIIEGNNGPFVAMPSRKLTSNCRKCRSKNHLKANYCNQCGSKIQQEKLLHDSSGRAKLYADIAHPINAQCREMIQRRIVEELHNEQKLAQEPGYRSRYDEGYDEARHVPKPHQNRKTGVSSASGRNNVAQSESRSKEKSSDKPNAAEASGDKLDNASDAGGPSDAPMAVAPQALGKGVNQDRLDGPSVSGASVGSIAKSQLRNSTDSDDMFGKGVFDV